MRTQWYINQLTGLFNSGKNTPIHLLKAKNDEYHQRFMTLREKGILEGEGLTYNLESIYSPSHPLGGMTKQYSPTP